MERMMEIVNYVMKQILVQGENSCSERSLVNALEEQGYSSEEIWHAFSLLYSLTGSLRTSVFESGEFIAIQEGQRVFSPIEKRKLTLACQGEIIRLMNNSFLSPHELEKVLFEAVQMDHEEVGLRELEAILHKVIPDEERLLMIIPQPIELKPSLLPN